MGKTLKRQRRKEELKSKTAVQNSTPLSKKVESAVKLSYRIELELERKNWDASITLMNALIDLGKLPKLGNLQRWVRLADLSGNSEITATLLNAIMRTAQWEPLGNVYLGDWEAIPKSLDDFSYCTSIGFLSDIENKKMKIAENIFTYPPNTIQLDQREFSKIGSVEVPFCPGAFVITNVFSAEECNRLILSANTLGFNSNSDYSFGSRNSEVSAARESNGRPAEGCFWLVDELLLNSVFQRVQTFLPQHIDGCELAGLNARWRFYRYDVGAVYRPHLDGSWPGSGLSNGRYVFDAFGDRWSKLTFLIYLNDDFEGGCTNFYLPSTDQRENEIRGVIPRIGSVLCFPHGSFRAPVHEGGSVLRGSKYVMRSDVLYKIKSK